MQQQLQNTNQQWGYQEHYMVCYKLHNQETSKKSQHVSTHGQNICVSYRQLMVLGNQDIQECPERDDILGYTNNKSLARVGSSYGHILPDRVG